MKFSFLILSAALILVSCGEKTDRKQFEDAGGCLKLALDSQPSTYIAREVTDVYSQAVLTQVMECLVSVNPQDLSIQPQLAKSWRISPDGLSYTFVIRENVLFHPHSAFKSDEERVLSVADVKFSIEETCKPDPKGEPASAYLSVFNILKGATEFYEKKASRISGLTTKGNEITLTLTSPDASFINKLAQVNSVIVSRKVVSANKETDVIGTGPFLFTKPTQEAKILLLKNDDYYLTDKKGNALPYLDSVLFVIESRKLEQLDMFERGETHVISRLPTSRITQMLEGRIQDFNGEPPLMVMYNNPLLLTNFYFFNMMDPRFKDPRVRQAFNYAIDRNRLAREVLRGQAYENGIFGIVPPISATFKGYDFAAVKAVGYDYNPGKARKLLADAGYPGGEGFGTVNLRVSIGEIHSAVAEEVSERIFQTLGINVNINGSSFEQKDVDADYGRGDLFRGAWRADYCSPETFLTNFYGKYVPANPSEASQLNQSRYKNPAFDALIEQARAADSQKERYRLYNLAEIELMKDPPLIVLWYSGDFQLSYKKVRNLKNNPMALLDLKEVYLKDWTKEEYLKSIQ
jgi:ABC-type transport system substrate-binding protein